PPGCPRPGPHSRGWARPSPTIWRRAGLRCWPTAPGSTPARSTPSSPRSGWRSRPPLTGSKPTASPKRSRSPPSGGLGVDQSRSRAPKQTGCTGSPTQARTSLQPVLLDLPVEALAVDAEQPCRLVLVPVGAAESRRDELPLRVGERGDGACRLLDGRRRRLVT